MRNRLGWLAALAVVGAASGCSDSDGSAYDDLTDQYDALVDASDRLPLSNPDLLPLSGGATYDGIMVMSTDGDDGLPSDLAGDMTLRADFGDDTLSGSVDDVVTDGGDRLEGSLDIERGDIDRNIDLATTRTYTFDMDGVLTENDGTDLRVAAEGRGDFLGEDHQRAAGNVEGLIASDEDVATLRGGFIGTR